MRTTPLEAWIATRVLPGSDRALTLDALQSYQAARLRETLTHARERSRFYREQLADFDPERIRHCRDLAYAPFTTAQDIAANEWRFVCVSQSEADRVVTLMAPWCRGPSRSVYFTAPDLELTIDFFHHGMATLVHPDDRVLILMPGERPGSVGDLLVRALARMNAHGLVHGLVMDPEHVIDRICNEKPHALVGIPAQVLSVARHAHAGRIPEGVVRAVLLSADYVPDAVVRELERTWGCRVFSHYGTSEMGFGGGVECDARDGYHLREADLFVEIVDPNSGEPQKPGDTGEVVFTTLNRRAMPLIRYRTGDLASTLIEPCPCGSVLPRLGKIKGRLDEQVQVGSAAWLSIHDVDEALFQIPHIDDYDATLFTGNERAILAIGIYPSGQYTVPSGDRIRDALLKVPPIARAVAQGRLSLGPVAVKPHRRAERSAVKRRIIWEQVGKHEG